jgi:hypothetical protein
MGLETLLHMHLTSIRLRLVIFIPRSLYTEETTTSTQYGCYGAKKNLCHYHELYPDSLVFQSIA